MQKRSRSSSTGTDTGAVDFTYETWNGAGPTARTPPPPAPAQLALPLPSLALDPSAADPWPLGVAPEALSEPVRSVVGDGRAGSDGLGVLNEGAAAAAVVVVVVDPDGVESFAAAVGVTTTGLKRLTWSTSVPGSSARAYCART